MKFRKTKMNRKIKLTARDGQEIETDYEELRLSELIRTAMDETEANEMPIPMVEKEMLDKIIEFCTYYHKNPMKEIPKPLPFLEFDEIVERWYFEFITTRFQSIQDLYDLIKATDYMMIQPLQELACARIASMVRKKEPAEIKKILGIEES